MDCNTLVFPVLFYLLEFAQIHVHWVGNAIQPSHPLSPPSPHALKLPSISIFFNELALLIRWPKYWSFSFSINSFNEYLVLTGLISLLSKRHLCVSSLKKQLVFYDGHESPLLFRLGISTKTWFFFSAEWTSPLSNQSSLLFLYYALGTKTPLMTTNNV